MPSDLRPGLAARAVNAAELLSWLSLPALAELLAAGLLGDHRQLGWAAGLAAAHLLAGAAGAATPLVNCWTLAHAERLARGRGRVRPSRPDGGHHVLDLGGGLESSWTPAERGRLRGWRREVRRVRAAGQGPGSLEREETE